MKIMKGILFHRFFLFSLLCDSNWLVFLRSQKSMHGRRDLLQVWSRRVDQRWHVYNSFMLLMPVGCCACGDIGSLVGSYGKTMEDISLLKWAGKPICIFICADSLEQVVKRRKAPGCSMLVVLNTIEHLTTAGDWSQKAGESFFQGVVTSYFPVPWWHTFCFGEVAMWRFAKEKTCGFIAAQLDTPMDVKLEQQTGDSWLKRPSHTETIPGFSKPDKKAGGECCA